MDGGFNQMRFNTSDPTKEIFASGSIQATGDLKAQANIIVSNSGTITGQGELSAAINRDIAIGGTIEGISELSAAPTRVMEATGTIEGQSSFSGKINIIFHLGGTISGTSYFQADAQRFHVDIISFTGEFKPGEKITIDSDKLKFTKDGQNALHMMQGDFFDLNAGDNDITYTDDQAGRSIRLRLTHQDRFL